MADKITWNGTTKIGTIIEPPDANGVISLNVRRDIWSGAVDDWQVDMTLRHHYFPISYEGGSIDPVSGAQTGPLFRLLAPWKLQMYDAVHELRLTGVFRTDDGSRYWLPPPTAAGYAVIPEVPEDVVAILPAPNEAERVTDVWRLHGLDPDNPMTVTPTTRTAGDIDQTITGDGETTSTVTRT